MSGGADWRRTCEGCAHIVNEPGQKGALWARCFAPGLSAPVIKCKKPPRKKCSFVAEEKEKR